MILALLFSYGKEQENKENKTEKLGGYLAETAFACADECGLSTRPFMAHSHVRVGHFL